MKNWLAVANWMYRHTLAKIFVNSASRGESGMIKCAIFSKSRVAMATARSLQPETICGNSVSSCMAFPSATRSGQKATTTSLPVAATISPSFVVIPGKTVLRRTMHWPSRRCGMIPVKNRLMVWKVGFKCSSTGVPITTTTNSADAMMLASMEACRVLPITDWSAGSASVSTKGILPASTISTDRPLMS